MSNFVTYGNPVLPTPGSSLGVDVPPEVGSTLKAAVQETLRALEQAGVSDRAADEFIRDYEGPSDD